MKVLPVGTRLQCGSVLLEVTQIGKDCHSHCTIYYQMGKCIMPSNGIFARVLQEGEISVRDTIYRAELSRHGIIQSMNSDGAMIMHAVRLCGQE